MGRTIHIMDSDEVMAMFGSPGKYFKGRWQNVRINKVSSDESVPLIIRESLVDLVVPTIFTKEQIERETKVSFPIPRESRLAYCPDVIDLLNYSEKYGAARLLKRLYSNPLDMYVIEKEICDIV